MILLRGHLIALVVLNFGIVSCNSQGEHDSKIIDNKDKQDFPVTFYKIGKDDIVSHPLGGVCMMGGRTENDNAMKWFLSRAQGGDVLVMRASGEDGYNNYFFHELGVPVNSVETIVFHGTTVEQTIIERIENAEAIWFAGGNQAKYVEYWKGNAVGAALQAAINRGVVIGGTSAGMAILGEYVWTGEEIITDFLSVSHLENVITDTHFSERERMPRLQEFIRQTGAKGIAADEYTAVVVEVNGVARVYGDEEQDDFAFFVNSQLEIVQIKGKENGEATFDLTSW